MFISQPGLHSKSLFQKIKKERNKTCLVRVNVCLNVLCLSSMNKPLGSIPSSRNKRWNGGISLLK
jgi:hypothetical protein